MAQNVTLYNLLISCPGDIKKEVTLIEAAVDEFNELYTETLGINNKNSPFGVRVLMLSLEENHRHYLTSSL